MKILIAEDDPISRRVLQLTLEKFGHEVICTCDGSEAWAVLQRHELPQLAILDWMMPGIEGPEICRRLRAQTSTASIYVILLTALNRKEDVIAGLEAGADDYLAKPFDRQELRVRLQSGIRIVELQQKLQQRVRDLEAAIVERKRAEEALRNLTLTDELTGLYNHRGFFTLAEHHLKSARRSGRASLMFCADMDGLKQINDNFGHGEGSAAIASAAEVLRRTFRESDIVARVGGDEFAILATSASPEEIETISARLNDNLLSYNLQSSKSYQLALSLGAVWADPRSNTLSVTNLLAAADERMYDNKRSKLGRGRSTSADETRFPELLVMKTREVLDRA